MHPLHLVIFVSSRLREEKFQLFIESSRFMKGTNFTHMLSQVLMAKSHVLTKGDNNDSHDRGLYNRGQKWLHKKDIVGRVNGYFSFLFPLG